MLVSAAMAEKVWFQQQEKERLDETGHYKSIIQYFVFCLQQCLVWLLELHWHGAAKALALQKGKTLEQKQKGYGSCF